MVRNADPSLRRNRLCFFHKCFQDDRIHLSRSRHAKAAFVLPVLEDANSIQVALMQVMRLAASQQIEHTTASFSPLCPANRQPYLRLTASRPASTTSSSIRAMAAKLRSTPASGRMMMLTTTKEDVEVAKPDPVAAFAEQLRQEKLEKARKRRESDESLKRWLRNIRNIASLPMTTEGSEPNSSLASLKQKCLRPAPVPKIFAPTSATWFEAISRNSRRPSPRAKESHIIEQQSENSSEVSPKGKPALRLGYCPRSLTATFASRRRPAGNPMVFGSMRADKVMGRVPRFEGCRPKLQLVRR